MIAATNNMTINSPQDSQDPIAVPPDADADTASIREPFKLFQNEARWREALRIEEEYGGDIGVGRDWGTQLGAFLQDPVAMESLAQLRGWMLKVPHAPQGAGNLPVAIEVSARSRLHPTAARLSDPFAVRRQRQL